MRSLARPSEELELMDAPEVCPRELDEALHDIAFSNRWLGGTTASLQGCADLVRAAAKDGGSPVRVLEVGAGGGDFARALCRWGRRSGIELRVLAVDLSEPAVRHAAAACRGEPWVSVVRGDAFAPPLPEGGADVVHAAMFLHHVPRALQAEMLSRLAGLGRVGVAVVDLLRTRWAHEGVRLFGMLTRRGRLFRHDGPLSVARGFTLAEAQALALASGRSGFRVQPRAFGRLSWVLGPSPLA